MKQRSLKLEISRNEDLKNLIDLNQKLDREQISQLKNEISSLKTMIKNDQENFQKQMEQRLLELRKINGILIDKNEKIQSLEDEVNELQFKIDNDNKRHGKAIVQLEEEIEKEKLQSEKLSKANSALSREFEDSIAKYSTQIEILKERVDDIEENAKKKRKNAKTKLIIEKTFELSRELNFEQQESQIKQVHSDYDTLSRMLNSKIQEIINNKKKIQNEQENEENMRKLIENFVEKNNEYILRIKELEETLKINHEKNNENEEKNRLLSELKEKESKYQDLLKELKKLQFEGEINRQESIRILNQLIKTRLENDSKEKDLNENAQNQNLKELVEKLINSFADSLIHVKKLENEKTEIEKGILSDEEMIKIQKMNTYSKEIEDDQFNLLYELERLNLLSKI
ncbi:hypothetical protein M0811_12130 [Anaeramoeba ignava]|uniref:Uncharacterized protein n=1 Tax=Anaeramoeba ignava TaxID=1746090 RepID=A0A9Q0LA56_ANAIG|nr:hypothetical protein M0811_12130 [Anaeramoeba ignava]